MLDTVRRHARWLELGVIVVNNESADAKTKSYLRAIQKEGIKALRCPSAFNFADMNNRAMESATRTIVGLLNNDTEAVEDGEDGWLNEILSQLLRPTSTALAEPIGATTDATRNQPLARQQGKAETSPWP